ncbi:organic hydroperoxide reductase OsmC/OhrA [Arthrobacter sp. V4I6]|nr:organic hydroperoxide reductase OsmC/OhrA [Arthrobacter sp. V4I6]
MRTVTAAPAARDGKLNAEALVARAHRICPDSNATRGNMTVDISILEVTA